VTEQATVDSSQIGLLMANSVNATDSKIGVLLGGEIEGNPDISLDGRYLAIIGASFAVTWFALRRFLRS